MFSKNELLILSKVSRGTDDIPSLMESTGKSRAQVYKIAASLQKKDAVTFENGKVIPRSKTHISLLLSILRNSRDSYIALSGHSLDILVQLKEAHTLTDVASAIGLSIRTVQRSMDWMLALNMVRKDGWKYSINEKMWPHIIEFIDAYDQYNRSTDPRAPPASIIFYASKDLVLFSNDKILDHTLTAFSRYSEMGIRVYLGTKYYCNMSTLLTIQEIFTHSLHIITADEDWRLRMMALIFYVKFKDDLKGVAHPMKNEMDRVLSGESMNGWVPLKEMQERAEMYEVDLYA